MRTILDVTSGEVTVDRDWVPEPVPIEPQPAPFGISRAQLRLWLHRRGIPWSAVLGHVQALPAGPARDEALILFEDAIEFDRRAPLIRAAALALPLRLTQETVDAALEAAWREAAEDLVAPSERPHL